MRKLASIQKIRKIEPIDGADRIELAHVLGWQCIVKKDEFKEGDLAVYFEIDSFLPVREEFEFLRSSSYKNSPLLGEGFRLRTQKMRGQISQGLLLSLSSLGYASMDGLLPEGTDMTEILGVKKWEEPERATTGGTIIGRLPGSIPKTDETRIQNCPDILNEFGGREYYITTKMDGSSHSISYDENGLHVCGHNYEYKDDGKSSFYEFLKRNGVIDEFIDYVFEMRMVPRDDNLSFAIQGEFCGEGIQSNRLKLTEPHWYVFTVLKNGKRVGLDAMLEVCGDMGLEHVPIEERDFNLKERYPDVDAVLLRTDGTYPNGGPKEGVVVRPTEPVYSESLGAELSFKAINNKYLLKHKD